MKLIVYTDWGSRWNPWNSWLWVYIIDEKWEAVERRYKNLWVMTNNEAEYLGWYHWVKRAIELGWTEIDLKMDSKLVISQLSWEWKIKKDNLRKINEDILSLIKNHKVKVNFIWIPREENKEADRLSNVAMDDSK